MSITTKLRSILNRQAKVRLVVLLVGIIMGALLETLALSVISPFISVLLDSTAIYSNSILNFIYELLRFEGVVTFLAFLAFSLAFIYVFRGIYMFVLSKIQYRFLSKRQMELSNTLLGKLIGYPYAYHANKNIAELQRVVLIDVSYFTQLLTNVLLLISDFFMSLFILVFLLVVSLPMTLCVIGLALICVFVYFRTFRKK